MPRYSFHIEDKAETSPPIEAVIGRGVTRHGAPARKTQKMPLRIRRLSFGFTPRLFFGNNGSMTLHSKSVIS
jgi:hypothetical protein